MMTLQIVWFLLVGVLLVGYAVLDGFDLGVGLWHLFTKKDEHRRVLLRSIGPFWDGNEVWLITGGGALFAAFPPVYASVFSGFYLALFLVLMALIFRAVAIEFRSQEEGKRWRNFFDWAFSIGSLVPALVYGVAIGNLLGGVPLDAGGDYHGGLFGLLNPYALLIGVVGLMMFATHGALWIGFKTEGELSEKALNWARIAFFAYAGLFVLAAVVSLATQPQHLENYKEMPVLWILPVLALAGFAVLGLLILKRRAFHAFLASAALIALLFLLVAAAIFPALVPAVDPKLSLTAFNSSSSKLTLSWMLGIAIVGMPFVLGYTVWVYRSFAGVVKADDEGYGH